MLRSFAYAAEVAGRDLGPEAAPALVRWMDAVRTTYLEAYYQTAGGAAFLPPDTATRQVLLDTFLIEKALYEIRYELNNRPELVGIPVRGLLDIMGVGD
jgi:maltose alpha-D-glucosyltransferase/alpha-amylase